VTQFYSENFVELRVKWKFIIGAVEFKNGYYVVQSPKGLNTQNITIKSSISYSSHTV